MLASLALGLTFLTTDPGLGSSGCLSEDIRAVPTAWREEHWEQNISGDYVGLSHWSISFVGTMDTMLAAAFHIWKPTELGTVDLSKKATELHWILNNTIKKPTSTSHCQLMSCQPSCASPDLQPQTFGQNKGPRDQSPNSCRQLKARFPSKHRRFD